MPKPSDWSIAHDEVGEVGDGEVLVRNHYISVDPAMRVWVKDGPSYVQPVAIGEVMRALSVGDVIESRNPAFAAGDFVAGWDGVQAYNISDGAMLTKVDPDDAPLYEYLNSLGIAGLTAYVGLLEIGVPAAGQTILVSGAAGSVGAHVGQLGKISGCRVVGIAGGAAKCDYLRELGFDAAIDYKTGDLATQVAAVCPEGVDIFFDNVGGEVLDVALGSINEGARVVLCGRIADVNSESAGPGPSNYFALTTKRARMEGFIYADYRDEWPRMIEDMKGWMAEGLITSKVDIVDGGVEMFPEVLPRLFTGENFGKLMIRIPISDHEQLGDNRG